MISTAIITLGICIVIVAFINAVKTFAIDNNRRAHKAAALSLWIAINQFVDNFNETYCNTQIDFYVDSDGIPHIDAVDVELNTEE